VLPVGGIQSAQAEAFDGSEDVVGGLGPPEGSGIGVDGVDVVSDGLLEFLRGAMDAAAQLFFREHREEAFHLVQPRGSGGSEVDVPARVPGQPALHSRGLVGDVVVHDQMDLEIVRDAALDHPQELEELPAAVPWEALSDDRASGDVQAANSVVVPWRK